MAKHSDISEKILKSEIKKAGKKAIRENMALGITTTALLEGNIVEIAPDETITIIKKLESKPSRRLTKRHFTLG